MNEKALEIAGVSKDDFLQWCADNHKPAYKKSTKTEFFRKIQTRQIVRNTQTGKIVNAEGAADDND